MRRAAPRIDLSRVREQASKGAAARISPRAACPRKYPCTTLQNLEPQNLEPYNLKSPGLSIPRAARRPPVDAGPGWAQRWPSCRCMLLFDPLDKPFKSSL